MRYKELLLEYNKPKLIQQYSKIFDNKSSEDHKFNLEQSLFQLDRYLQQNNISKTVDPYIKWIVHRYVTDGIKRWEDVFAKTIPALVTYDKLKKKNKLEPNERDINRIKSEEQLLDLIDKYKEEELTSGSDKEKEIENNFYKTNQVELLYNTDEYKIVKPLTEEASCYFGRNTRWCTAAQEANYFQAYKEEGPLYIILHKPTNRRWQFHFESMQFMDEKDNIITKTFVKEHPEIIEFFKEYYRKYKDYFFNSAFEEYPIILKIPQIIELRNMVDYKLEDFLKKLGFDVKVEEAFYHTGVFVISSRRYSKVQDIIIDLETNEEYDSYTDKYRVKKLKNAIEELSKVELTSSLPKIISIPNLNFRLLFKKLNLIDNLSNLKVKSIKGGGIIYVSKRPINKLETHLMFMGQFLNKITY